MKNYSVIAFDLDGTLTDPKRGLTSAFAYGLRKIGLNISDVESLKKFIGPPLRDSFRDEYGLSERDADDALMLFRYIARLIEKSAEQLIDVEAASFESDRAFCLDKGEKDNYTFQYLEKIALFV